MMRMSDTWTLLRFFPENGLDRSLHAPVFVGLIFLSFFRETLGWTFAGLVVPGYLATVLVAAPITGALVVAESTLAYSLALILGRLLPRTGVWFTFFGRERFLLIIACSSCVRLAVEASLLPVLVERWHLTHSRELYSLGLVLVPLLANSFWNAGFIRAFPRVSLVTGLTFLVVSELLLPYTNFTLSRFQVANESVSLAFLESPHAHIVLLVGAIVAARNNVRYGWDYNGILVPALLAVAWYQPSKVATTLTESVVVFLLSQGLIRLPPWSRLMIVGSRRVLLTFSVGFALKFLLGAALFRWFPQVELLDFFGFGYLLPSLLANKMWDRQSIASVLMPTLQVSLLAFPLGTLIAFGLRTLDTPRTLPSVEGASAPPARSVPLALLMGDLAPAPSRSGSESRFVNAYQVAENLLTDNRAFVEPEVARNLAARGGLRIEHDAEHAWTILTPDDEDPNADPAGPRVAVRNSARYGDKWLIVVHSSQVASPLIPIAFALSSKIGARAIVLRSRFPELAQQDDEFALKLASSLKLERLLSISTATVAGSPSPELAAVGQLPSGLSTQLVAETLGRPVKLTWRLPGQSNSLADHAVHLLIGRETAELAASQMWAPLPLEEWTLNTHSELRTRLAQLTGSDPAVFAPPRTRSLRLYGELLHQRTGATHAPSLWQRALAQQLGLRFAIATGLWTGWTLYEPLGANRRGLPTLLRRRRVAPTESTPPVGTLALTLAAPRWLYGGIASTLRLASAFDPELLLLHGTLVNLTENGSSDPRRPTGRRSWFQRAHEVWLEQGGVTISVRGKGAEHPSSSPVTAGFDTEVTSVERGPEWTHPLTKRLQKVGLRVAAVDGTLEQSGLQARRDPAASYSRRFAPNRTMRLWLSAGLRRAWRHRSTPSALQRRLEASPLSNRALLSPKPVQAVENCRARTQRQMWTQYSKTQNPFYLAPFFRITELCGGRVWRDAPNETVWLSAPSQESADSQGSLFFPLLAQSHDLELQTEPISSAEFEGVSALALGPIEVLSP